MTPADPIGVAIEIAALLDELTIRYVIGGSVAASLLGEPRSTLDLDLMIDCEPATARALARRLQEICYVDEDNVVEAAKHHGSFNAIHFGTSLKIDFFFAESDFARDALRNRRTIPLRGAELSFYAVEDLIVRKLHWFRLGNETSERQWRDIAGMLRLNRERLERDRLRAAATAAGVVDLLDKAIAEVESFE